MAKKEIKEVKQEEELDFTIDSDELKDVTIPNIPVVQEPTVSKTLVAERKRKTSDLINCLRKEIIEVKHLPQAGTINEPRHVLSGGMAETAFLNLTVPRLRTGTFKNVLTDDEKDYLEAILGLEAGAMNVYNKENNFWSNNNEIARVRLEKQGTRLDLSDPIDYIKYKILLANKDLICPDLQTLQDKPKATYKFVLISENSTNSVAKSKMSVKMQCYVEYGKIESNAEVLRTVIEIITGKPLAANTKLDFLQTKAGELIESDAKVFLNVVKDPYLANKVLIQKCLESGLISKRGNYLYLRSDGTPLCENGEEPVLSVAAKYLSSPKRQELKFSLETKLNMK